MTNYEKIMQNMTVEQLAGILVRPALVNNTDMYYMTSTGQLFPFKNPDDAVRYEYAYLTEKLEGEESEVSDNENELSAVDMVASEDIEG